MKTESRFLEQFFDKFSDLSRGTEIEVTEKGIKHYGVNIDATIMSKVTLSKSAFTEYGGVGEKLFINRPRVNLIKKVCGNVDENINFGFDETSISLKGTDKECNILLSEKPMDYKTPEEKDWSDMFDIEIEIDSGLSSEIKNFIKDLDPEQVYFKSSGGYLNLVVENNVRGIDAKFKIAELEEEIEVGFNPDLILKILKALEFDYTINLKSDSPLRIVESNPMITTEFVVAPIVENK